jgi:hypothetical protein
VRGRPIRKAGHSLLQEDSLSLTDDQSSTLHLCILNVGRSLKEADKPTAARYSTAMGSFKKPFQLPPEVDVDVDAPSQPATGSRRPASTMANEEPKMSRRDRSGSLPSRLMGSRLMGLVLPIPKVERQAPEEGEELEPYIARLKVKVVKADGLLPCRDPYIICTYDHDQAVLISKTSISIDVHFDERKTHEKIHKWETSCYL